MNVDYPIKVLSKKFAAAQKIDLDDCRQQAELIALKARRTYNPGKQTKWETYLWRALEISLWRWFLAVHAAPLRIPRRQAWALSKMCVIEYQEESFEIASGSRMQRVQATPRFTEVNPEDRRRSSEIIFHVQRVLRESAAPPELLGVLTGDVTRAEAAQATGRPSHEVKKMVKELRLYFVQDSALQELVRAL